MSFQNFIGYVHLGNILRFSYFLKYLCTHYNSKSYCYIHLCNFESIKNLTYFLFNFENNTYNVIYNINKRYLHV